MSRSHQHNISAELTEEDKLIFMDHDRYRGPQMTVSPRTPAEEEEIALGDDVSSEAQGCINEANQILANMSLDEFYTLNVGQVSIWLPS